jgi:hypothetical protein
MAPVARKRDELLAKRSPLAARSLERRVQYLANTGSRVFRG